MSTLRRKSLRRKPLHGCLVTLLLPSGVESITRILDTLCERDANNTKLVRSLERADATTPEHGVSPTSSSEAKRKRAKERQAKLLKQFASKQRIFEAHMESGDIIQVYFKSLLIIVFSRGYSYSNQIYLWVGFTLWRYIDFYEYYAV